MESLSSMVSSVSACSTCLIANTNTGCVAGPKGALVKIQDALKKPWPEVSTPPAADAGAEPTATA
jgi:large subunit ribosomal protein L3